MALAFAHCRYLLRILPFLLAAFVLAWTYRDLARLSESIRTKTSNALGFGHNSEHGIEGQNNRITSEVKSLKAYSSSAHAQHELPSPTSGSHAIALTTPAIAYPTDYLPEYRDDDECHKLYGPGYLEHLATHHIEFCEAESKSSLECFRTHRFSGSEVFCIGRGVVLDQTRGDDLRHTAMHCKLRNFSEEKIHDSSLRDWMNPEDMDRGFFDTSVQCQLENWNINTRNENVLIQGSDHLCDAEHNDGRWTLLVKRENHVNFWHKMLEIWQSMIVLDVLKMSINPATNAPYLTEQDIPNIQVVFTEYDGGILNPVDDWWEMVTGNKPIMQRDMDPTCLGNVILPLQESTSPYWGFTWEMGDCHEPFLINAFLRRLYRHLDMPEHHTIDPAAQTVVTIIDRKGTRKLRNQEKLIANSQARWPDVRFQLVDFATTSLREQVTLVRNSDILVGLTGAGMTHIFWLPEESSVAEIQAPGALYGGFRHLCKLRNLNYFTVASEQRMEEDKVTEGMDWQLGEWVDVKNDAFQQMIDAAINAQMHKGTRWSEVYHKEERGVLALERRSPLDLE